MARKQIRKVGVLGAGVMGSGIAAHVAGAGYPVLLLDIVPPFDPPAGTDKDSRQWRDSFATQAKARMLKARPAAYHSKKDAELIEVGNLSDDLERLNECDWVIEAVKEDLGVKQELYSRIDAVRKDDLVLTTNTSGLPIADLTAGSSEGFRKNFFVTHFFNPPRYMRLLEIVEGPETDAEALARVVKFGENVLGKGLVYGKDTPNFVANRIGTFGMLDGIHHMLKGGFSPEEMDVLFGKPLGHPKSALFRTGDLVGLDTFVHVANNCYDLLEGDEEREVFKVPAYLNEMVKKGLLGNKSKAGFYKKTRAGIETYDPTTGEYREREKPRIDAVGAVREIEDTGERIKALVGHEGRYGELAWTLTARMIAYSARRLGEIADDVVQIDRAMKWGFNWDLGPFETWDAIGFVDSVERMKSDGIALPEWVDEIIKAGVSSFYRNNGEEFFDVQSRSWKAVPQSERSLKLPRYTGTAVVEKNDSATLYDLGDGVFGVEFHSKMNSVDPFNTEMLFTGIARAEEQGVGLVIANEDPTAFSAGANLMLILMAAQSEEWEQLEQTVAEFQNVNQRLKFANVPVVAAPFGLTLGGGAEIAMGAQAIRAHAELYMGLVEVGVGVIPGGGGTKEVLWRLTHNLRDDEDIFPATQRAFETIGMAKMAFSAKEAKEMGFLQASDRISFNRDELIYDAKQTVLAMQAVGFAPTAPRTFRVGGNASYANLSAGLWSMLQAHQLSEHDHKIGKKLAYVLSGGDVPQNAKVSEQYLLDLEREAFLSLVGEEKTKERMMHMLQTGKPLRN